jgi:glycosyltransferase involved in cell wall biosynthesis
MRVCMVMSSPLPPSEGIGSYVWNLSRFLSAAGHRVQIITRSAPGKPGYEQVGGIPIWRPRFLPLYPLHVDVHGLFVQRLVGRLGAGVDLFHLHTPLPPPLQVEAPYLLTVHSPMMAASRALRLTGLRELLVRLQTPVSISIEKRLLAGAAGLAVVARSVAGELGAYGIDRSRIRVVGNGVDVDLFRPPDERPAPGSSEPTILAAGRLDVKKGLEDLIESMRFVVQRYPDARLWLAGDGPLQNRLRRKTAQLGLGQAVGFLGHVAQAQMVGLYQAATVFVHASHYEGLPTVLLEAMACGKGVVSTAVSGALDVVEDGVNGLLVAPSAPGALAEAISRLLADAELRARLGAAGRHTVEEAFSWPVVARKYASCYQDLLAQGAR